jgi:serine/threonine protein kinase
MNDRPEHSGADLDGFPVASDPDNYRAREPLEVLVSRFSDAVRRGEHPSIDEYADRFREWAPQIRDLFPLIQSLERWKSDKEVECLKRSVPDEFPVRQLGRYRLLHELGRGGMGIVFEAVHDVSGKRFALKLLPWRFAADMHRWEERFRREATTIARLRHPGIVQVFSFGTYEGYCYYVMQLVEGVSLDWIIRRLRESTGLVYVDEIRRAGRHANDPAASGRTLPATTPSGLPTAPLRDRGGVRRDSWFDFAGIGMQVALALAHAHEAGVLHNDIKPANLLLDRSGHAVVTDFGIGRRGDENVGSAEDRPIGTLRYMAPERLLGHCDARSDVYSLGVTLYELVTQTPAFAAEDKRELMELILSSQPRPLREIVPHIPRALETVILNAIAREPQDRYPSAQALANDLLRLINGLPVASRQPGLWRRALRRLERRSGPRGDS